MSYSDPSIWTFSRRAEALYASPIREIGKRLAGRPDVISFAGGMPSPKAFPVDALRAAADRVLSTQGDAALQYGPTGGHGPLRAWIAEDLNAHGASVTPEQVQIVSGSQQGLDIVGKALLDEGATVCVETPTYVGALQALSVFRPNFVSVTADDDGIVPEAVEQTIADVRKDGCSPSLLYTIPTFQNPTGRTMPLARREGLVAAAARARLPLIEDNPYSELDFKGAVRPTLLSLAPETVIYLGSFSKILSPGLRLGYVVSPPAVNRKIEEIKQAADLHTSSFAQMIVAELLASGFLDEHLPRIRALYAAQCEAMLRALEAHFPREARWTRPKGGMFIWVSLPPQIDTDALLEQAMAAGVAYVPGAAFFGDRPQSNNMRLSFATSSVEEIAEGVKRLARVVRRALVEASSNQGAGVSV